MFASRVVRGVKIPCVVFYVVSVLFIVAYGSFIRRMKMKDHLARRIYHHPICQDIDGWSVSHLLLFGLLGVLYPGHHLQFLLIGIGWEVIETALGQNRFEVSGRRVQLVGDQDAEGNMTGKDDAYWYGKESDIVVDIFGYSLGSAWATRHWPNPADQKPGPPARAVYVAPPAWV
jgi:hypothetical protein